MPPSSRQLGRLPERLRFLTAAAIAPALLAILPHLSAQDEDDGFRWLPARAQSLRSIADAVDQARSEGDVRGLREALVLLAESIVDEVPDGGFAISGNRWIGPGAYLQEALAPLPAEQRGRIERQIELILEARLAPDWSHPPGSAGAREALERALRLVRDFPSSRLARDSSRRALEVLLESGQLEAYRALVEEGDDQGMAESPRPGSEILPPLAPEELPEPPPSARRGAAIMPRDRPWVRIAQWSLSASGAPSSPWHQGALMRRATWGADGSLFLQDRAEIRCTSSVDGEERWRTPFYSDAPSPLPGSTLQPGLTGSLLVTTTLAAVTAFDRESGEIIWEIPLARLLSGGETPPSPGSIVAIAPPAPCERGVLVAAALLEGGTHSIRVVLLGRDGEPLWSRPLGSAPGGTYLALGSASPAIATRGERGYLLTGRGYLCSFHILDGALLWAASYPAFPKRGSGDALRHRDHFQSSVLEARGGILLGAPIDASALWLWDQRTGALLASIPRGEARWWRWGGMGEGGPIALSSTRGVRFFRLQGSRPVPAGSFQVPAGLPELCGRPAYQGGEWWLPHAGGFYRVGPEGGTWSYRALALPFKITGLQALGGRLLLHGDGRGALLAPWEGGEQPPAAETAGAALLEARRDLLGGDIGPLIERLETLAGEARGGDAESRRELARLAEELLDMARAELLMLEPGMRARLTAAALRLLPDGDRLAGAAFRAAVAAARRGERGTAAGFGYLALESQRGSTVTLDGILRVPVELAVRRLLEELRDEDGVLSGSEEAEQLAHRRLEELRVGDLLGPLLETARRFPCTPSGRRAMLQAARDYYQRGSLDQGILTLRRLILLEPETPEAVEARFRLASLYRESRRPEGAREILEELRDRYGGLTVTASRDGESHDETVAVRAERILGELPEDGMGPGETPASAGHHLAPVWRMRSELHFRGSAHVEPLERHPGHEGDTRLLLIAHRTVQLREASTGDLLWSTTIPPPPSVGEEPSWSRLLAFEPPLSITDGTAIIRDREELLAVDLEQGHVRWRLRLPPLSTVEGGEEEDDAAAGAPPNLIGEAVVAGDTLIVSGADQGLHAHDVRDGAHLWSRKIALTLAGPPHVAGRLVLLGSGSGRRVEVRNIDDGALDVVIPLEEGETLAQEPWFLDDTTIAIPLREGRLLAVNAKDGEEIWSRQLPGPLKRVLLLAGVPFLVAELHWHRDRPTLLGIHGPSGRILWEKRFRGHRPSIYEIRCFGGDLFLTEGENDQRKVIRLEVPRAFLEEEVPEGLPAGELRRRWTAPLKQGWDVVHLHLDQEWILAEDGLRCEVTPFSRETGAPLYRSLRYRAMEEFLKGRRRLFFADFVGDTLVLMTSRGGMGLRAFRPLEEEERLWEQLLALSPLADPAPGGQPLDASETAYRLGQRQGALRILERALEVPGVAPSARRRLTGRLEGIAQEEGEHAPLAWGAPRMPRTPLIDGSLDEPWNSATAFPVRSPRHFHSIQGPREDAAAWRGWRDQSAILFTGWSDEGFHLALDVTDDSIHPYERDAERWRGDCLLLAFDFRGDGGLAAGRDDQLLTLALTVPRPAPPGGGAGGGGAAGGQGEDDDDEPEGRFHVQRKGDESGVIYEVTIPWETFRSARGQSSIPYPGMHFGLNLVLTDDDSGGGASSYFSLSAGQMLREETRRIWDLFAPEYFPRVTLGR